MIKIEKGSLLASLDISLILLDYHLASNLTSILLAYNWVFFDSHLLNSNFVGTNCTTFSWNLILQSYWLQYYYLQGFCMGEFFFFLMRNYSLFGMEVLLLHKTWDYYLLSFLVNFELFLISRTSCWPSRTEKVFLLFYLPPEVLNESFLHVFYF